MDAAVAFRVIVVAIFVLGSSIRVFMFGFGLLYGHRKGWSRWQLAVLSARLAAALAMLAVAIVAIGFGRYRWTLVGLLLATVVFDNGLGWYVPRYHPDAVDDLNEHPAEG